jgi:hypothetical protein
VFPGFAPAGTLIVNVAGCLAIGDCSFDPSPARGAGTQLHPQFPNLMSAE